MITKNQYLSYLECPRYYYNTTHNLSKNDNANSFSLYIRHQSIAIKKLAYQYFGEYTYIEYDKDYEKMALSTQEALKASQKTIVNATFIGGDIVLTLDLIHKDDNEEAYHIYDIKSSTRNKVINLDNLLFEYYVLKQSGCLSFKTLNLMQVDKGYHYQEPLVLQDYFKIEEISLSKLFNISLTNPDKTAKSEDQLALEIAEAQNLSFNKIKETLEEMKTYSPSSRTIAQAKCKRNHAFCGYFKECFKELPPFNVFRLCNLQKPYEFYNKGLIDYQDLKPVLTQSEAYALPLEQIIYALDNKPLKFNKEEVWDFIKSLTYPINHLDFETVMALLPNIEGLSPIDIRITQYSIHKQKEIQSEATHYAYLQEELYDNRAEVAQHLIKDLGKRGTILAYNASFEASRIRELAAALPAYKDDLEKIASRIKDLEMLFDTRSIYTPDMEGSASIKHVLPGLLHDNSYKEIDCQNGQDAITMYDQLIHTPKNSAEHQTLKRDLITYSTQDTYSMVLILNKIYDLLKDHSDKLEYYLKTVKVTQANSKAVLAKLVDLDLIETPVINNNRFYIEDECDFIFTDINNAYYKAAKMIIKEYK